MKYIIKNCPAIPSKIKATYGWCNTAQMKCQDCTDCLLKQIVEKCKAKIKDDECLNCNSYESGFKCWQCDYEHHREDVYNKNADVCFAQEILSMLEIQECEDEKQRRNFKKTKNT